MGNVKGEAKSDRCAAGVPEHGRAVEIVGAFFEGADHAAYRLAEEHLDKLLHQPGFEFEIDIEIDATTTGQRLEHPVVVEAAEGPLGIGHIDASRSIEGHARGKALTKHAEPDNQIGDDEIGPAFLDAGGEAPRQKLGIALDIGDERKELLR